MLINPFIRCWAGLSGVLSLFLAISHPLSAAPLEIWVAPPNSGAVTNSGAASGSRENPLASIEQARLRVRSHNANMTDDIIVNIMPGEYSTLYSVMPNSPIEWARPIAFYPEDSGSNGHYVIYRAVDGPGTVRIVGSKRISGWTQVGGSGVWAVNTGSLGAGAGAPGALNVIYENGKFAWPARKPNLEVKARFPQFRGGYQKAEDGGIATSGTRDWIQYFSGSFGPADFPASLPASASVMWWKTGDGDHDQITDRSHDWGMDGPCQLLSASPTSRQLTFFRPVGADTKPARDERFFLQGLKTLQDAPGEFFHEVSTSGTLYYRPLSGDPNAQDIRIPTTNRLIDVIGGTNTDGTYRATHHLKFEGLSLAFSHLQFPRGPVDGLMTLQKTQNIEIRDCQFSQAGGLGIYVADENEYSVVEGCWVHHTGVGGILVRNTLKRGLSASRPSQHHTIKNCKIHDLGEISTYAVATLGVGLFWVNDTEVSNCEIFNSARYATSLRGHWSTEFDGAEEDPAKRDNGNYKARDNVFQYIRASDCLGDSGDAGILHAAHLNGSGDSDQENVNTWNQFLISGAYADASMKDEVPNGIFFDHPWSCLLQRLRNIKIAFTQGNAYRGNDNPEASQDIFNASWCEGFNESAMEYEKIGLTPEFPAVFDDRNVVIVDDLTVDYSESDASWATSGMADLYKGDGRHHHGGAGSTYAQWRPVIPRKGGYEVSFWKTPSASHSAAAPLEIHYRGGLKNMTADLRNGVIGWTNLGEFPFEKGRPAQDGYVRLRPGTDSGVGVRADALQFRLAYTGLGDETGWWRFDGSVIDASGNGNEGTCQGGAQLEALARGNSGALSLNGSSGYVQVADAPELDMGTGNFAISAWFYRVPNAQGNLRILSKGAGDNTKPGYALLASDNGVSAMVGLTGTGTNPRLDVTGNYVGTERWHHVVLNVNRSGKMTLYIDGKKSADEEDMAPHAGRDFSSTDPLCIGKNANGLQFWPGKVDDVRIFQRTLNEDEISALANPFWWKFDNSGMDVAGYGYQAERRENATFAAHPGGKTTALSLDGIKAYATVKNDPELDLGTGDFAISTWFYRSPKNADNLRILSKGAGVDGEAGYAIFGSNTEVRVALGVPGQTRRFVSGTISGPWGWNHLAANFQRTGSMSLYINGQLRSSVSIADWSGTISSNRNLEIGRNGSSESELWAGRIDEVRIFKRILPAGEIAALSATAPDVAARTVPQIVSAVSRHVHGSRTEDLAIFGERAVSNVEPRRPLSGGTQKIIVNFDQYVSSGTVSVVAGTAMIDAVVTNDKALTISLKNVSDRQKVTLRVSAVQSLFGRTMTSVDLPVRFLAGDLTRDGQVTLNTDGTIMQNYQTNVAKRNETTRVVADCLPDGMVDATDWAMMQANFNQSVAP